MVQALGIKGAVIDYYSTANLAGSRFCVKPVFANATPERLRLYVPAVRPNRQLFSRNFSRNCQSQMLAVASRSLNQKSQYEQLQANI